MWLSIQNNKTSFYVCSKFEPGQDQPMQVPKVKVPLEKKLNFAYEGSLQIKDKYVHLNVSLWRAGLRKGRH